MGIEIERKFLPASDDWKNWIKEWKELKQGYLINRRNMSLRIRSEDDQKFIICYKGAGKGISVPEYEMVVWRWLGSALLRFCAANIITKARFPIHHHDHLFEVDVFKNQLEGLVLIEVEMKTEEETVVLPSWIGHEVSRDHRYKNAVLVRSGIPD